jgi:hypothetical protein
VSDASEKRVRRAVEMARLCFEKPELEDVYLRRFHRAMDALESRDEGEAVYDACRGMGWYRLAAAALARSK